MNDSLDTVNPHYLENVMKVADKHEVVASDDIHNAAGIKLVAKGQRIDQDMRERLVQFKLREPLERKLTVSAGIGTAEILAEAEAALDRVKPLSALFRSKGSAKKALAVFKGLHFDQMGTLLLSMQSGMETLPHSVLVSLLGVAFALGSGIGAGSLNELALAGLLHDVGELYINPEYLRAGRKLMPEEWKHIVVHPHIGQLVIGDIAEWPQVIAVAVGEHHERLNGFGYPRQLSGEDISALGKVLLTSEAMSSLFTKEKHPFQRACLGAKLIPGEYPFEMVSMIACFPSDVDLSDQSTVQNLGLAELLERAGCVADAIEKALEQLDVARLNMKWSPSSVAFLEHTHKHLLMLRGAMSHTGLSPFYPLDMLKDQDAGPGIGQEIEVVIFEIEWRLSEVLRHIALMEGELEEELQKYLAENVTPSLILA